MENDNSTTDAEIVDESSKIETVVEIANETIDAKNEYKTKYDKEIMNVIACTDKQVSSFINWIQNQSWYPNTTVVILGDHYYYQNNKEEALKLAAEGSSFNLTLLTADTHAEDGYLSDECDIKYDENHLNINKFNNL